jgi:hypothetical protein
VEQRKRDKIPTKEYVNVLAVHWWETGKAEPIRIQTQNGAVLAVSKVLDARRAASLRTGGQGMRYECRVANAEDGHMFRIYLFHDGDFWFIEKSKNGSDIVCADGTLRKLDARSGKERRMP